VLRSSITIGKGLHETTIRSVRSLMELLVLQIINNETCAEAHVARHVGLKADLHCMVLRCAIYETYY